MDRQLVSIQKVLALDPIPEADRIEAATILGWKVIVKKGDFKVGDYCVFFEIDSVIPFNPWNAFLAKSDKPIRLRTVKMKKQISQGLAMPLTAIPQVTAHKHYGAFVEGEDLTEFLGVTKYEPPPGKERPAHALGGRPSWIAKTDETRVQSIPWILEFMAGREVYITQKLDGSSLSVARHLVEGDVVCSRNLNLKLDDLNNFTRMGNSLLLKMPPGFLIQGELVGPGIQDNRMGLSEVQFYCFNVYDLAVAGGKMLSFAEMVNWCNTYDVPMVPILSVGQFKFRTVEDTLEAAKGKYLNGHPQEGIVIRPVVPENHHKLGMLSFKAINNEFLLKTGE